MSEFKMYFMITVSQFRVAHKAANTLATLHEVMTDVQVILFEETPGEVNLHVLHPLNFFPPTVGYNLTCWIYQTLPEFLKTAFLFYNN